MHPAELGLPFLILDMDSGDPRDHSPGYTLARLEAFVELLEQRKRGATIAGVQEIPRRPCDNV